MRESIYIFLLLLILSNIFGQTLPQTIRGNVLDKDNQLPLISATTQSANKRTTTDTKENFRLEQMPLGRHELAEGVNLIYADSILIKIKAYLFTYYLIRFWLYLAASFGAALFLTKLN